jgi:hypothetical protein
MANQGVHADIDTHTYTDHMTVAETGWPHFQLGEGQRSLGPPAAPPLPSMTTLHIELM